MGGPTFGPTFGPKGMRSPIKLPKYSIIEYFTEQNKMQNLEEFDTAFPGHGKRGATASDYYLARSETQVEHMNKKSSEAAEGSDHEDEDPMDTDCIPCMDHDCVAAEEEVEQQLASQSDAEVLFEISERIEDGVVTLEPEKRSRKATSEMKRPERNSKAPKVNQLQNETADTTAIEAVEANNEQHGNEAPGSSANSATLTFSNEKKKRRPRRVEWLRNEEAMALLHSIIDARGLWEPGYSKSMPLKGDWKDVVGDWNTFCKEENELDVSNSVELKASKQVLKNGRNAIRKFLVHNTPDWIANPILKAKQIHGRDLESPDAPMDMESDYEDGMVDLMNRLDKKSAAVKQEVSKKSIKKFKKLMLDLRKDKSGARRQIRKRPEWAKNKAKVEAVDIMATDYYERNCRRKNHVELLTRAINAAQLFYEPKFKKLTEPGKTSLVKKTKKEINQCKLQLCRFRMEMFRREEPNATTKALKKFEKWAEKNFGLKKTTKPVLRQEIAKLETKLEVLQARSKKATKRANVWKSRDRFKKQFDYSRGGSRIAKGTPPTKERVETYYKNLLGTEKIANTNGPALKEWKKQNTVADPTAHEAKFKLNRNVWDVIVRKLSPWKATGPDKVFAFMFKHCPGIKEIARQVVEELINQPESIRQELCTGRTVLITKIKNQLSDDPKNYRPITCLNVLYKLVTATIDQAILTNTQMPVNQRAARRGVWAAQECLLIDKAFLNEAKKNRLGMHSGFIDIEKAFDQSAHNLLKEMVECLDIHPLLKRTLYTVMGMWRTRFQIAGKERIETDPIQLKKGIFQGDKLSVTLFLLAISPVSTHLNKHGPKCDRATLGGLQLLNHLFYIDDLKLYADGKRNLRRLIELAKEASEELGMKWNLAKCNYSGMSGTRRRNYKVTQLIEGIKPLLTGCPYRYLGIEQLVGAGDKITARKVIEEKMVEAAGGISQRKLTAKDTAFMINVVVLAIFKYATTVFLWTRAQICSEIRSTIIKQMTQIGFRWYTSSTARLFMSRARGGRGIDDPLLIHDLIIVRMMQYFRIGGDQLTREIYQYHEAHREEMGTAGLIKVFAEVLQDRGIATEVTVGETGIMVNGAPDPDLKEIRALIVANHVKRLKRANEFKEKDEKKRDAAYDIPQDEDEERKYHGRFQRRINAWGVASETFQWMKAEFNIETEALIVSMQDGTHPVNAAPTMLVKNDFQYECRNCERDTETVGHVLNMCPQNLHTTIKDRHDEVSRQLFLETVKAYGMEEKMTSDQPANVRTIASKDGLVSLMWEHCHGKAFKPGRFAEHGTKPDFTVVDKRNKIVILVEVSCPWWSKKRGNNALISTYRRKLRRYLPLADALRDAKNERDGEEGVWKSYVAPVIIGSLGEVSHKATLISLMRVLGFKDTEKNRGKAVEVVQKLQAAALRGSVRVMKRHVKQEKHPGAIDHD